MIPTPHIEVSNKDDIAKTVLMPGDPLRAKYIAETYLENVVKFNTVRNMFGYTGTYKGRKISVMGSGMGMPSIGIYSYELFNFYDVERIIRIGSCGSYDENIKVYDVILVTDAFSESSYASTMKVTDDALIQASPKLTVELEEKAMKLGYPITKGRIHSSDVFYRVGGTDYKTLNQLYGCLGVEMESFALFANARALKKEAACLLTVSDSFTSPQVTTSKERETSFNKMMEIALEMA